MIMTVFGVTLVFVTNAMTQTVTMDYVAVDEILTTNRVTRTTNRVMMTTRFVGVSGYSKIKTFHDYLYKVTKKSETDTIRSALERVKNAIVPHLQAAALPRHQEEEEKKSSAN